MRSQVLVALLAIGCGSKESKDAPKDDPKPSMGDKPSKKDRAPTGTARPQSKLKVTLDGKPVDMQQALAWKDADGAIRVTASSVPVGCDEVTGSMRRMHDGEVTFDVTFGNTLSPDGTLASVLKSTYYSGMTSQSGLPDGPSATTGDAAPKSTFTAEVDFKTGSAGADKHELVVKGTLDALGCEPAKAKAAPALPPEMPATIEVAGKKLPVRGAQISTTGGWLHLKLTTGPETCKSWSGGEMSVEISWKDKADKEPFQVSLGGSLLKQSADQTFDKKKLTVKPTPIAPGEIEIAGDITVMKYPVKLAGKVTAIECK